MKSVSLFRGRRGFGFTLSGQGPPVLSNVVIGSPAHEAGLTIGDRLHAVNGVDVSGPNADHDDVVALIAGSADLSLVVEPAAAVPPTVEDVDAIAAVASDDEEYMLPPVSRDQRVLPPPLHTRLASVRSLHLDSRSIRVGHKISVLQFPSISVLVSATISY